MFKRKSESKTATTTAPEPGAIIRLQKELVFLLKDPTPFVTARPDPANILEWFYVIEGP